jgi:hypothetical protein
VNQAKLRDDWNSDIRDDNEFDRDCKGLSIPQLFSDVMKRHLKSQSKGWSHKTRNLLSLPLHDSGIEELSQIF